MRAPTPYDTSAQTKLARSTLEQQQRQRRRRRQCRLQLSPPPSPPPPPTDRQTVCCLGRRSCSLSFSGGKIEGKRKLTGSRAMRWQIDGHCLFLLLCLTVWTLEPLLLLLLASLFYFLFSFSFFSNNIIISNIIIINRSRSSRSRGRCCVQLLHSFVDVYCTPVV